MDLMKVIEQLDEGTAKSFVEGARHVIDAMLIEAERVKQAQTPARRDYASAELSREAPGGGWLSDSELSALTQEMAEAIAGERWTDGARSVLQLLTSLGS
ncbi:MAG: hypothetical protein JXO22_10200 [Phycisphaerae bacterium]|nr:hypothetical protein [Phycisphaerae bacterium]